MYGSQYNSQYSSDSGYSTTTDDQQPRRKKMPHPPPQPHTDVSLMEGSKDLDIYATLPRKGTQKAALRSKEAEVYQAYLQRQKNSAQMQPLNARHRSDSESSIANLSTAGNHSRQSSGASMMGRMSKEEISQHLTDFVRSKQGAKDAKIKQSATDKKLQKMLKEDRQNMQRRPIHFKDGKQPLPVQPPTVPDSKLHMYRPVSNQNPGQPEDRHGPMYVDHKQLNELSSQSLMSCAQNLPPNHSRESSTSSSHTLKAHSRDNSLSSQQAQNNNNIYGADKLHANVTDRRIHNTSIQDMRPFPGAEPPNDPGGTCSPTIGPDAQPPSSGGVVAQRIAALSYGKGSLYISTFTCACAAFISGLSIWIQ